MTEEEREQRRAYMRKMAKAHYYREKARKVKEEAEREEREKLLPKARDILKGDCCRICKHFSSTGLKDGWCIKKKKSTSVREICGQFSPVTDEKFIQVIYKTPGVKYIKGSD